MWVGVADFLSFKSLDNNMVYSSDIDIFCKRNLCRTKVFGVLKFDEIGDRTNKNQNPPMYETFWFFIKNFHFLNGGVLFLFVFSHILNYKGRWKKKRKQNEKKRQDES